MDRSEASKIADLVKAKWAHVNAPDEAWLLADHHHEELKPGHWSLASEGYLPYDWPWLCVDDTEFTQRLKNDVGWWVELEAINGCILAMYDRRKDDDE